MEEWSLMDAQAGALREEGAVLVIVVLLMLATLGLGHSIFLSTRYELLATRAGARQLGARAAAEAGVELALVRGGGPWMDSVSIWGTGESVVVQIGDVRTTTLLRRLSPESWLVEATARHRGGVAAMSVKLAWVLDPLERVAALPGAVGIGAAAADEGIVGADRIGNAPLTDDLCLEWSEATRTRLRTRAFPSVHLLPGGVLRPSLGELDFDALARLAETILDTRGTPAPAERFGECTMGEAWNWGDPDRRNRPCGAYLPILYAPGDLSVDGGMGQGLLLVDGDLTLTAGSRYYGLILTTGALRLRGRAALTGYAVAVGGLTIEQGARIARSACWAFRALDANRVRLGIAIAREEPIGPL